MTRVLITALKILFFLLLVLALGAGLWLLAGYMGWPRWTAFVALAGLFFILVLILFLRRYFYRRREARFIRRVVDQDSQILRQDPEEAQKNRIHLENRWMQAVGTLRASGLRRRGNPLYTLPWFMVFGETGSGKSTAIAHARVNSILTEAGPEPGMASTRTCDWWFFPNAVVLDTAGRYAVSDEKADHREWETFLSLLARYRRKEPLNGLILTLPADRLLSGDTDGLIAYGRAMRLRMDQLMRVMGAKIPVYVLVTKLDRVLGMDAFVRQLPPAMRTQAVGHRNTTPARDPEAFLQEALEHIAERVKSLCLRFLQDAGPAGGPAFLFPEALMALGPAIRTFVRAAFQKNPYQETPFFRGFFLSSARQSGAAASPLLTDLESMENRRWPLPETVDGFFLHDFFDRILPKDRQGFQPLVEYLSWRRATANLALAAWLLFLLTGVGLASLSYIHIRDAMAPVHTAFEKPPELGKNFATDMVTLGSFRDRILEMENRLQRRPWMRLGFPQGREALRGLKKQYTLWFRDFILTPGTERIRKTFASMEGLERENAVEPYLEHLIWRVAILHARETGQTAPSASGKDDPLGILTLAFGGRLPHVAAFFPDLYRSYVAWEENPARILNERRAMQARAREFLDLRGRDLHWLVQWADTRPGLLPVTLEDFWSGPGHLQEAARISGAFTETGQQAIAALLGQLSLIAMNSEDFTRRSTLFWNWYARELQVQWHDFARAFDHGRDKLLTRNDWLNAESAMTTTENPYFLLIARMEKEFSTIRQLLPGDREADLLRDLVLVMEDYKARQREASLGEKISQKFHTLENQAARMEQSMAAAEAFATYMQQMTALVSETASMDAAFRFSSRYYGKTGQSAGASPMELALAALQNMRAQLGDGKTRNSLFWDLMQGPLVFMAHLNTRESACVLNDLWQADVVAETIHTPQRDLWQALFGEKGVVPGFLSQTAAPFLRRDAQGWSPGSWLDIPFPFRDEFTSFLDQAALRRQQLQPQYTVAFATLPTRVNREARSEPYQTRLTLQCAEGVQTLSNFNFPESMDFIWKPDTCGDVNLTILFRETSLTRTWTGQWGFRNFLREFRSGSRTYTPADFPGQASLLQDLGLRSIQVRYTLKDATPVMALETYPPLKVPEQIARCGFGPAASPPLRQTPDPATAPHHGGPQP